MSILPGSFPVSSDDVSPAATAAALSHENATAFGEPQQQQQQEQQQQEEGKNAKTDKKTIAFDASAGKHERPAKTRKLVRVLAIDGGGVRGIVPSVVLAYIERRTHKPIYELFDLVCGTSTGALLATCLAIPKPEDKTQPKYTASQCISIYEKECNKIFSKSLLGNLASGWGLFDIAYSTKGRNEVYEKYVGDLKLSDMLTDVLITAYDMKERRPFFFKSRNAKEDPIFDYTMQTVLQSTSAAPTYFEPTKVEYRPSAFLAPSTSPYTVIDKWGNEELEINSNRDLMSNTIPRRFSSSSLPSSPSSSSSSSSTCSSLQVATSNAADQADTQTNSNTNGKAASRKEEDHNLKCNHEPRLVSEANATETERLSENIARDLVSSVVTSMSESATFIQKTISFQDGQRLQTEKTTVITETQETTTTTTSIGPSSDADAAQTPAAESPSPSSGKKPEKPEPRYRCLIDGGTFANNPAMCGLAEALRHYKDEDTDVMVVSLGTGTCYNPYSYDEAKSWGMIGWARPILDIMLDGQANSVDYQLKELLGPDGLYYRFDTYIGAANSALDDSHEVNMAYLRSKGEEIVENRREELDRVCEMLVKDEHICRKPLGRFWWERSFPSELDENDSETWSLIT